MVSTCIYFQVHQPYRSRRYQIFDIGTKKGYFDEEKNKEVINKIAKKCYEPTNNLLLELINRLDGKFKVSFSITGVVLEQLEANAPQIIDSFKELVNTGCVEILNETYHHSLSSVYSTKEFKKQVKLHKKKILSLFNFRPRIFRNTELIYDNRLAETVSRMGHNAILTEGADHILGWRSPNFVYKSKAADIKLLLKNYRLSDDIAFRFGERKWNEYPLTAGKFSQWVSRINGSGEVVNLFMDYETFGEHQWADKGIFEFLKHMPDEILKHPDNDFVTPSEAISRYKAVAELDVPNLISWADMERDLSAWIGNKMQQESIKRLYLLEEKIANSGDAQLIKDWRKLQTSDHFYYMCTKWFADGDVHKYFNPFDSPYDAFISFMNILNDLKMRVEEVYRMKSANQKLTNVPDDKAFWFKDGTKIKNMREMATFMKRVSPDVFSYHVNSEKNDILSWVKDVIGDHELAEELSSVRKKENMASIFSNRIHELKSMER